jgi:hypothetical protein
MELTEAIKAYLQSTAATLCGADRRLFLARTVGLLGPNGQRRAERELGWNRVTIRKGMHELRSGIQCVDAFSARGRTVVEKQLPRLLDDIRSIIDLQSQTDPTFHSQRLYTRLTIAQVRRQLVEQKGYTDAQLPTNETLRQKVLFLGYRLRKVMKCKPKKRLHKRMPSLNG